MVKEIYTNPPLIESVFEIRFPAEIAIGCKIDIFYNKLKAGFPLFIKYPIDSTHLYDFSSKEQHEIIKVGYDRISYHARKYDGGFTKFQEDALKNIQIFINTYGIKGLVRTGLRYINHIPIVRIDGIIPLEQYINFGFNLPSKNIPNKFEELHTILLVNIGNGKLKILVQSKEIQNMPKTEVLVLDFDYIISGRLNTDKIVEYISESHKHTKNIFEDLISNSYRKVMDGDK